MTVLFLVDFVNLGVSHGKMAGRIDLRCRLAKILVQKIANFLSSNVSAHHLCHCRGTSPEALASPASCIIQLCQNKQCVAPAEHCLAHLLK